MTRPEQSHPTTVERASTSSAPARTVVWARKLDSADGERVNVAPGRLGWEASEEAAGGPTPLVRPAGTLPEGAGL